MAENNNSKPNGPQKGAGGKKPKKSWWLYVVYGIIIFALGGMLLRQDDNSGPHDISWDKLESVLEKHDYSRIIIVNQEFAEIYIKDSVVKNNPEYKDLLGQNVLKQQLSDAGYYKYEFVTFESFEKDLDSIEARTGERIDMKPEKRTSAWKDIFVIFGPFLILILFIAKRFSNLELCF